MNKYVSHLLQRRDQAFRDNKDKLAWIYQGMIDTFLVRPARPTIIARPK